MQNACHLCNVKIMLYKTLTPIYIQIACDQYIKYKYFHTKLIISSIPDSLRCIFQHAIKVVRLFKLGVMRVMCVVVALFA